MTSCSRLPTPKRGRPADPERRQENRRAILAAALAEFTDSGFSEARVGDIAQRAGIAKGTVYLYFDSKEALFEGVLRELIGNPFGEPGADAPRDQESVGDYLRRTLRIIFADFDTSPRAQVIRLVMAEGGRFPVLANSYHRIVIQPVLHRIERLVKLAVQRNEVKSDALGRYPMLVFSAAFLGIMWNDMFTDASKVDMAGMMDAHVELLFGPRLTQP